MKTFKIELVTKKPKKINGTWSHFGKITIGTFVERFQIPLDYWSIEEYIKQWEEGLNRIKAHDSSCFVSKVWSPESDPYVFMYVAYKVKKRIFFQEHATLHMDVYEENLPPFDAQTCYLYVRERTPGRNKKEDELFLGRNINDLTEEEATQIKPSEWNIMLRNLDHARVGKFGDCCPPNEECYLKLKKWL